MTDEMHRLRACSTNHRPQRRHFGELAISRGMSEADFDAWADQRDWWDADGKLVPR
jgi:hypothetical protein